MKAQFVWMPTHSKPAPQIWYGAVRRDKEQCKPLLVIDLPEEEWNLSLVDLAKRYPCPGAAENLAEKITK